MKVQTTLTGYSAWIIERLAEGKGQTIAEVMKYLIERWVDENQPFLEMRGITREDFFKGQEKKKQRPSEVVDFPQPADADSE